MLSIFPSLLYFQSLTPLLLRLTLGIVFVMWAREKFKQSNKNTREKQIGGVELVIGVFLIIGYLTQLAALASVILLGVRLTRKIKEKKFFTDGVNYYFILFMIAVCILISGSGVIAFDLPL